MLEQSVPPAPPRSRRSPAVRRAVAVGIATVVMSTAVAVAAPSAASAAPAVQAQSVVGLAQGSQGTHVRSLQQALIRAGVTVRGGADGVFGPVTTNALVQYQRERGLTANGRVDAATANALGLGGGSSTSGTLVGLAVGARGDAVRDLQRRLLAVSGYLPGGVDGVYGSGTQQAVSMFQRWNGLTVTGTVTRAVVKVLDANGGGSSSATSTPQGVSSGGSQSGSSSLAGLKLGARGEQVRILQRALIAAGISVYGGADGVFGPATRESVIRFQRARGLSASGAVDAATASALGSGSGSGGTSASSSGSGYVGLSVGARGDRVKHLQRALLDLGFSVRGGADGVFGPATKAALVAFQSVNGIQQNGVVSARGAQILGLGSSSSPQGVTGAAGYPVFGEHSSRVATLQRKLISAGITVPGGADGMFGGSTAGAVMTFQRRHGLSVTGKVDSRTAARLGLAATSAPAPVDTSGIRFDVFPVQGRCYFGDTWHAPRGGGRTHLGVDIIAAEGNLLYAVVDGTISKRYFDHPGSRGGNGLRLQMPSNGTYFTYLHLKDLAPGIDVGSKVKAGDVIGYVGNTGNSATPHLHLEVHPYGGSAINPYPIAKAADACHVTKPRS